MNVLIYEFRDAKLCCCCRQRRYMIISSYRNCRQLCVRECKIGVYHNQLINESKKKVKIKCVEKDVAIMPLVVIKKFVLIKKFFSYFAMFEKK